LFVVVDGIHPSLVIAFHNRRPSWVTIASSVVASSVVTSSMVVAS
jgi:hypothetical protein